MSHDIEANFTKGYHNKERHCQYCDSFEIMEGKYICNESNEEVPPDAHCDFFRSKD